MRLYEFAGFRLDADKRLLLQRDGAVVSLTPKAYETLAYLVEHSGAVVEKEQMIRAIWPDTAVEENNLTQNVSLLRRVLGEGRGEHRFIATVPGRGYQFVAPVSVVSQADGGLGSIDDLSIAVLPFVNNSTDPEYDYFADGLADELIHALSRAAGIRVAARTSSFSFKGKHIHLRDISVALGVGFVLEGTVRKSDSKLRITAQLVNAATGSPLWSERYEREIGSHDLFAIEDEITEAVMGALRMNLPCNHTRIRIQADKRGAARSPKAHELYLKGRFHLFQMTEPGIQTGIRYFERSIEENPRYAPAYVGLAHAYRMFGLSLERPPDEIGSKSKTAALQAVAIEENLAEAHAVLAFTTFWYEWNWEGAERHFERALELGADSADVWWMYAHLRSILLQHSEALAMVERARVLDPLSSLIHAMEGQFLLHAGRTANAVPRLKEAIELDPRSRVAHLFAAKAYIEQGLFEEGLAEAQISHDLCPANSSGRANVAYAHARAGRRSEAAKILAGLLELAAKRYVPAFNIAMIYSALGQTSDALAWLERGIEQRVPYMTFLASDPKWRNFRDDPRYLSLLRRLNLPTVWP